MMPLLRNSLLGNPKDSSISGIQSKTNKELCLNCNLECLSDDEEENCMICDNCNKWIHKTCTKLDSHNFDKLAASNENFFCHKCDKNFHKKFDKTADNRSNPISDDLRKIMKKLDKLDEIDKSIGFMSDKFDEMRNELKTVKEELKASSKLNKELQAEVNSLKTSVKVLQDELVSKKCFIKKIEVSDNEQPLQTVKEMVKSVGVSSDSVVAASLKTSKTKEKFIIAEFINCEDRLKFLKAKSRLREQSVYRNVIVFDAMGDETRKIFNYAAALRAIGYKFIYQRGGNVYAKKDDQDRKPMLMRSLEDVDRLLERDTASTSRS